METTELLLRRGADFTATDKKCFTPILACAKDDNVALCLASMLVEYFKNTEGSAEGSNRASVGMLGISLPSVYAVSVCSLLGCRFPVKFEFPALPGKPSPVCLATEFA